MILKRFRKKRFAEFPERPRKLSECLSKDRHSGSDALSLRKALCFSSFIDPFRVLPNLCAILFGVWLNGFLINCFLYFRILFYYKNIFFIIPPEMNY
ncbi:hypothetical protein B1J94_14690 [Leptospira kirschneri serovar Grippotyphosa]|nr:hypothetical protein B1J94_14690 [Leptospira kirschneri serovar Grippotyphosa]